MSTTSSTRASVPRYLLPGSAYHLRLDAGAVPRWLAERAAFALCARDFAQQLRTLARPLLQALRSLFTRIDVAQRQRVAAFATSVHHTEGP